MSFYRFVDRSYSQLEPLFIADPLLLYDFIFLCPEGDIQSLFQKIPAFLSLTWLSFKPVPLDPNKVCIPKLTHLILCNYYFLL